MSKPTHIKTIEKRRKRKEKLKRLREKYLLAGTKEEKERILEKLRKIAPWLSEEEFLAPLKKK
jgi:hypothetical protein